MVAAVVVSNEPKKRMMPARRRKRPGGTTKSWRDKGEERLSVANYILGLIIIWGNFTPEDGVRYCGTPFLR